MLNKTIVSIALAGLMLGALPAAAAKRSHEGSAQKVEALAHDLQQATRQLERRASHRQHFARSWSHWRAVRAVRQLDEQACRFGEYVERYGAADRRSQRVFQDLERALYVARSRADQLSHKKSLRDEFRRVERIVERLDTRLASFDHRSGDRDRHHRRWDDSYARLEWRFNY